MTDADVITSVHNPRVKRVARLRDRRHRRAEGAFIAEGSRDVSRALAAGLEVFEVFVLDDAEPFAGPHARVSRAAMARMSYRESPPDVLGVFATPVRGLDDLPALRAGDVVLVASGTEKPGNLGAMARTAAAAGCQAVVAAGADVDVWNPNALRNAGGALFSLPAAEARDDDVRSWLASSGVCVWATVAPQANSTDVWQTPVPPDRPLAVVIGPEHAGLDPAWLACADARVTVPMAGRGGLVDSLNASVTAAVVLFEIARRRVDAPAHRA